MFDAWYPGEKLKYHADNQVFFSIKILPSSKYYYPKKDSSAMQKATAPVVSPCSNIM